VNVSVDSLDHENYRRITGSDLLGDVLEGIGAAEKAGLTPIKLNMVILEGINEHEVPAFLSFVRGNRNLVLQLIELLEQPGCSHYRSLDGLEEALASSSRQITTRRMHHRKKYCADGAEVEVVRPLHNTEFCAFCNRLRVTSDGRFKPCLLRRDNHVDILGARGVELDSLFHEAVRRRAPFFT
jgi:cyclic pyranopterin phosphate synthase